MRSRLVGHQVRLTCLMLFDLVWDHISRLHLIQASLLCNLLTGEVFNTITAHLLHSKGEPAVQQKMWVILYDILSSNHGQKSHKIKAITSYLKFNLKKKSFFKFVSKKHSTTWKKNWSHWHKQVLSNCDINHVDDKLNLYYTLVNRVSIDIF